ncbi:class I SAM-dependent methyltransferase [Qipengyuania marisflavi]|uniref:Class I SAM-dependent methyltransferase n=1 Tax=Qipengyuania marisflavi TaxID=2486356 RepID=A0A5S3P1X9_9SPHN|nr:class I SAM-dependent methyltransferase [Qipengyuania marisflavi]TMM46742.1 class I SAM-dependent methyltransferase [Qipengyuania marisflavi]
MNFVERLYPETAAGGFARSHPRMELFVRIRSLLPPGAAVLDFGAGRGKFAEIDPPSLRVHTDLKPYVDRFAAFDVDEAVLENIETDDRHYAPIGAPLPFADNSFDLVYSTWVAEHIADAGFYSSEIARILKPGGWFCSLTPNKNGPIALAARMVPNHLHSAVLRHVVPSRQERDTFPTCYKLNTISDVGRHFPGWKNASYYFNGPAAYHGNKIALARLWQAVDWVLPKSMAKVLAIFVQKPLAGAPGAGAPLSD